MTTEITVHEKYSKNWPLAAFLSLLLSVTLFIFYLISGDVLIAGYLRLLAFGFFALGLLSLFKIKDGQVKINILKDDDDVIHLIYEVRNQLIGEEKWAKSEMGELKIDEMPNRSLYNDIMQSDRCIRFRRNENSEWIYLNKVSGRVIPLSQHNAKKVHQFLLKMTG